ncbi:Acetamidase/Formamidase [Candidatus Sulfopaludibacter sp. SbA3]|nr:Acetamidase/Formamidase [Candidatus Sulfopaludibacter sp. SbA3]
MIESLDTMRLFLVLLTAITAAQAADYQLKATPGTVAWGYYWSEAKPVLRIKSGDTVSVQTMTTSNPNSLARGGVKDADIQPELKKIYAEVTGDAKGPGGHILTGPIYIEEAEPGDVLEVRIQKIELSTPYATNGFSPQRGVLPPTDFQQAHSKVIPLDMQRNVARFADNIEIPLHPFFGSMGVAPDPSKGRVNSAPPGDHAGNIDNKDLVVGTKLFIPVHVKGALFEVGDGHAGQGNGEVDITAMETSLVGTFQFVVRKDMHLKWPRGETPTHWIAMGLDPDLTQALILAVRETIDFLVTEKHLTREDAYALASVAVDFNVTQAVDGTKGVHGMIPKSIFK